jgi:outer membrane protein
MKSKRKIILVFLIVTLFPFIDGMAQEKGGWTLENCIDHALQSNIQVRKTDVVNRINSINLLQSKYDRLPSVDGTVHQGFDWMNQTDAITGDEAFTGINSTSYSVGSSVTLFNGFRLKNNIKQSEIDYEKGIYDTEVLRESITISITEAYLNVLYSEEQVNNSVKQTESTKEELALAQERLALGSISKSDYLQVKSQLSSEELTLVNSRSQYAMARVTLMQLMELPVSESFQIVKPDIDAYTVLMKNPDPQDVFNIAIQIKPEIKSADLKVNSSELAVDIARASYLPKISMDAGISTNYRSSNVSSIYGSQLGNNINPSAGLTLSIPIFSKRQTRSQVQIAEMGTDNADLDKIYATNQLRKEIEQVCLDVRSSEAEYEASRQQFVSTTESFTLANEKYIQGMMNSVDYLFEKTNLIIAESKQLQSKFNMIFNYKMLDFYMGIPMTL